MKRNSNDVKVFFHSFGFKWRTCSVCGCDFRFESYWSWKYNGLNGYICMQCAFTEREAKLEMRKKLGLLKRPPKL